MVALFALAAGLVAGFAAGGSLRGLSGLRLRGEMAILATFVIQGVARGRIIGTTATAWGMAVWIAASILLAVLLLFNVRQPGMVLAAGGTLLNLDVVLANGAMPVLPTVDIKVGAASISSLSGGFYHMAHSGMMAIWAGDVIPLSLLGQRYFLSIGDVLLGVGVAIVVASSMVLPQVAPGSEFQNPVA